MRAGNLTAIGLWRFDLDQRPDLIAAFDLLIQVNSTRSAARKLRPSRAGDNRNVRNPDELRKLASWYREFAERAGNPAIWERRLRTADDLEAAAECIERASASQPTVQMPTEADPAID